MQDLNMFLISFVLLITAINAATTKSEFKELKDQVAELQSAFTKQD